MSQTVSTWEVCIGQFGIWLEGRNADDDDVISIHATDSELVALRDELLRRYPVITRIQDAA
jgi:hypothetical protein